jgi:Interferon-induced transmembrane protein/zinc-ribbon domain
MFCIHCGAANPDSAQTCSACGRPLPPLVPPPLPGMSPPPLPREPIPNHLAMAIVSTVLCCMPFGIVAIVYAAQVDGKAASGDLAGAQRASRLAKMWYTISMASWLGMIIMWLIVAAIAGLFGGHRHHIRVNGPGAPFHAPQFHQNRFN